MKDVDLQPFVFVVKLLENNLKLITLYSFKRRNFFEVNYPRVRRQLEHGKYSQGYEG